MGNKKEQQHTQKRHESLCLPSHCLCCIGCAAPVPESCRLPPDGPSPRRRLLGFANGRHSTVNERKGRRYRFATEEGAHYDGLSADDMWAKVQGDGMWYKFDCVEKIPAFLTDIYSHYYVVESPDVNYLCATGGYTYDNSDFWAMMQDFYETLDAQYAAAAQQVAVQGAIEEQGRRLDAVIDALEA